MCFGVSVRNLLGHDILELLLLTCDLEHESIGVCAALDASELVRMLVQLHVRIRYLLVWRQSQRRNTGNSQEKHACQKE